MRKSKIPVEVERAKRYIYEWGCVTEAQLFLYLSVGVNTYYWIKKIIREDPNFVVKDGLIFLKEVISKQKAGESPQGDVKVKKTKDDYLDTDADD